MKKYKIVTICKRVIYEAVADDFVSCVEVAIDQDTDLSYADMRFKNLSISRLDGGIFRYADFTGANLIGANLSECDFTGAIFSQSNLIDADFTGANISSTIFEQIDKNTAA